MEAVQDLSTIFQSAGALGILEGGIPGGFDVTSADPTDIAASDDRSFDILPQMDYKEFIDKFKGDPWSLYNDAASRGMGLQHFGGLVCSPKHGETMHVLERAALESGYMLHSIPTLGAWSDPVGKFFNNPQGHVLLTEYINGLHRVVAFHQRGRPYSNANRGTTFAPGEIIQSTDHIPGSYDLPWYDSMTIRYSELLDMQVPFEMLTSRQESIMGGDWREPEVDIQRGARSPRLQQGDSPQVRLLKLRDQRARLYKRALAVRVADEAMRRCRVDRLAEEFMITMINDKIAMVYEQVDTIFNGDDNEGTAAVRFDPNELDPDGGFSGGNASTNPTYTMWDIWKRQMMFENMSRLDILVGDMRQNHAIRTLPHGVVAMSGATPVSSQPIFLNNDYSQNVEEFRPVPEGARVVYYIDVDVEAIENFTDDQHLAVNRAFGGVTYITEIGGTYTEQQREALRGANVVVASQVYGMAKRQKGKASTWVSYNREDYANQVTRQTSNA